MSTSDFQNGFILGYVSGGNLTKVYGNWDDFVTYDGANNPFKVINEPQDYEFKIRTFKASEANMNIYNDTGKITLSEHSSAMHFSKPKKCPAYLGFRIKGAGKRLYLYILKKRTSDNVFEVDTDFILDICKTKINGTTVRAVNCLKENNNQFIHIPLLAQEGYYAQRYFIYKIAEDSIEAETTEEEIDEDENEFAINDSTESDSVTLLGSNIFPQGESDIIATTPHFIKTVDGQLKLSQKSGTYYSVVLPSNCFYAVLPKNGMPRLLKGILNDTPSKPFFSVSYQTGKVDGKYVINETKGASFGVIPEGVGAALLRLPKDYDINDIQIYTDKLVKSNDNFTTRRQAKDLGKKIIKDFKFKPVVPLFWNDDDRNMTPGNTFYGIPYSSRWFNSHYIGFEVSPETALNAFNDPYSVAYDGGYYYKYEEVETDPGIIEKVRTLCQHTISNKSEIKKQTDDDDNTIGGGPGYGLVCSAFTNLINGNPYPQSNVGYTFDSNFTLQPTMSMNSGQVLVNDGFTHCVFVDEIYKDGFSLYEAVDPCVAKTTHTCAYDRNNNYANNKINTSYLKSYPYSVANKDISGYDKVKKWFSNLNEIIPVEAPVRPWRGHKCVYGNWDVENANGSGIGVTIHRNFSDGTTLDFDKFKLNKYNSDTDEFIKVAEISIGDTDKYKDIAQEVKRYGSGTYRLTVDRCDKSTEFKYYTHTAVQLTFDSKGKAIFKNVEIEDNKVKNVLGIADDVDYAYITVFGYGGDFAYDTTLDQTKETPMIVAAGKYYPDLAKDISKIKTVRSVIISDPDKDYWGSYSCTAFPKATSEYVNPD